MTFINRVASILGVFVSVFKKVKGFFTKAKVQEQAYAAKALTVVSEGEVFFTKQTSFIKAAPLYLFKLFLRGITSVFALWCVFVVCYIIVAMIIIVVIAIISGVKGSVQDMFSSNPFGKEVYLDCKNMARK